MRAVVDLAETQHPADAETVGQQANAVAPEGVVNELGHLPAFAQACEQPIHFRDSVARQRQVVIAVEIEIGVRCFHQDWRIKTSTVLTC